MAVPDFFGEELNTNEQVAVAGYIVESDEVGDAEVDSEDVMGENGVRVNRLIYKRLAKRNLSLIVTTGTPKTQFVVGTIATILGTTWYVDSCTISETKSATRVQVTVTNIGITHA